ncbi:MAG: TetR/AcrR family transcriptional regulator [Candidatus Lindowbacteria bacterium]|nr:TetR/AcrR family transcriptional regulator [Candidatus Lindowbacteria bacterium]
MKSQEPAFSIDKLLAEPGADPKALHEQATSLTRRKILLAAMECFASKGYQKTTIREIAAKAGMTLGAVYHHFEGKKELLIAVTRSRQVNSLEMLRHAIADREDFFDALRQTLKSQFKLLAEDPILRGVTREYFSMAMVDPDANRIHSQTDIEYRDFAEAELERRLPNLPPERRNLLIRMFFVAIEGLMTGLVVDSPLAIRPEETLDAVIDTFQNTVEGWEAKR